MNKQRTSLEEDELFALCVEGGLVTSTPEFVQSLIDKYKNDGKDDIRTASIIKRLENIKIELLKKNNPENQIKQELEKKIETLDLKWNKLKDWIESEIDILAQHKEIDGQIYSYEGGRLNQCNYILDKIQELEKGIDNNY